MHISRCKYESRHASKDCPRYVGRQKGTSKSKLLTPVSSPYLSHAVGNPGLQVAKSVANIFRTVLIYEDAGLPTAAIPSECRLGPCFTNTGAADGPPPPHPLTILICLLLWSSLSCQRPPLPSPILDSFPPRCLPLIQPPSRESRLHHHHAPHAYVMTLGPALSSFYLVLSSALSLRCTS